MKIDRIVFRSPAVPPLPTVVSGVYQVRFRVVEPVSGFELPVITYYVIPEPKDKPQRPGASLNSIQPANDALARADSIFEWTGRVENCKILKFSVFEKSSVTLLLPVNPYNNPQPNSDVASALSLCRILMFFRSKGQKSFQLLCLRIHCVLLPGRSNGAGFVLR